MDAYTRRIDDDHIRLLRDRVKLLLNIAADIMAVRDTVQLGIGARGLNRIFNNIYTVHILRCACHQLRYGPRTAIEVIDRFARDVRHDPEYIAVKSLNGVNIGLEESKSFDLEFQSEYLFVVIVTPLDHLMALVNDCIRHAVVEGAHDTDDLHALFTGISLLRCPEIECQQEFAEPFFIEARLA